MSDGLTLEKVLSAKAILDSQPPPELIPVHMSTETMRMFGGAKREDGTIAGFRGIPVVINEAIPKGRYWLAEPMPAEQPTFAWKL